MKRPIILIADFNDLEERALMRALNSKPPTLLKGTTGTVTGRLSMPNPDSQRLSPQRSYIHVLCDTPLGLRWQHILVLRFVNCGVVTPATQLTSEGHEYIPIRAILGGLA